MVNPPQPKQGPTFQGFGRGRKSFHSARMDCSNGMVDMPFALTGDYPCGTIITSFSPTSFKWFVTWSWLQLLNAVIKRSRWPWVMLSTCSKKNMCGTNFIRLKSWCQGWFDDFDAGLGWWCAASVSIRHGVFSQTRWLTKASLCIAGHFPSDPVAWTFPSVGASQSGRGWPYALFLEK